MRISSVSVSDNRVNKCSESNDIKSLSTSCQLSKNISNDLIFFVEGDGADNVENENPENMQPMMMTTMISQYRVEAMLGGDQEQEDNPIYISDW